jgi:hypothetical protein
MKAELRVDFKKVLDFFVKKTQREDRTSLDVKDFEYLQITKA